METLSTLKRFGDELPESPTVMPAAFVGHGSPMNAVEDNEFSRRWVELGRDLPRPNAILCVSAHWETRGTYVTAMEKPETIHDFGGFPDELFAVRYPAPGSPSLAQQTQEAVKTTSVGLDTTWGLDHGCWSVVKRMYPDADIPVLQLSLDRFQSPKGHYILAHDLASLRKKGVLILGSGNMVHNLGRINWRDPDAAYDWAQEAKSMFMRRIVDGDRRELLNYASLGTAAMLAIPTPEHFLPLLYVLGLQHPDERIAFFNDKTVMGSIAMTSFTVGL